MGDAKGGLQVPREPLNGALGTQDLSAGTLQAHTGCPCCSETLKGWDLCPFLAPTSLTGEGDSFFMGSA